MCPQCGSLCSHSVLHLPCFQCLGGLSSSLQVPLCFPSVPNVISWMNKSKGVNECVYECYQTYHFAQSIFTSRLFCPRYSNHPGLLILSLTSYKYLITTQPVHPHAALFLVFTARPSACNTSYLGSSSTWPSINASFVYSIIDHLYGVWFHARHSARCFGDNCG